MSMEAELSALILTLKELAERQAEIMAQLDKLAERLDEMQMEVNADVSDDQGI